MDDLKRMSVEAGAAERIQQEFEDRLDELARNYADEQREQELAARRFFDEESEEDLEFGFRADVSDEDYDASEDDEEYEGHFGDNVPDADDQHVVAPPKRKYNMMKIDRVALFADEYQNSNVNPAAIINAYIADKAEDEGVPVDPSQFLDANKIKRARARMAEKQRQKRTESVQQKLDGVYYDSVISRALQAKELHGMKVSHLQKEDLYVLVDEPGGKFFANFSPEAVENDPRKKGLIVADTLYELLIKLGVDTEEIKMLGADSTNLNTGWKEGVNALLEKKFGHKVYWSICSLHLAELALKALIVQLDGTSSAPDKFSGPIGRLLNRVEDIPIDPNFTPLSGHELPDIPAEVEKKFTADQKYIWRIAKIIASGEIPDEFEKYSIGLMHLARWMNTASRAMRLKMCDLASLEDLTQEDIANLDTIVIFILDVYLPYWLRLKQFPSWLDAPRHFLFFLERLRQLDQKTIEAVQPTMQRGSWCCHQETLLQTMICSEDEEERRFAVNTIIQIRKGKAKKIRKDGGNPDLGDKSPRNRFRPKINFEATSLRTLTPDVWEKPRHEPLLTCHIPTGM